MKKQKNRFKINYYPSWTYGVSINQMKEDLKELEKLGADQIDIELVNEYYGGSSISITASGIRWETDEEMAKRINEEKAREEQQKEYDLKAFEALKKRLGK